MGVVKAILRAFSYVFHGLLALFLAAVSGLALATSTPQWLHLDMLPWTGSTLATTLFFGSLFGLVTIILALMGRLRFLFFLWSLLVMVLMIKGFFFSSYRFEPGNFKTAFYLVAASVIALFGAWFQMMRSTSSSQRRY